MDIGTQSPLAEQEKEASKAVELIEQLRRDNSDLRELVSRLKDMVHRLYIECKGGEMKPDSGGR